MSARQYTRLLVAITLFGFVIRWVYLSNVGSADVDFGDALHYHLLANILADGHGFLEPVQFTNTGVEIQAAAHPPLWPLLLSIVSMLGGTSFFAHQFLGVVIGTATIPIVGLTGRELVGRRGGLIAAGLAAVHPGLWIWDAQLLAETLAIFTVAVLLLLAYKYWKVPSTKMAAFLGVAAGASALARSESALLFLLIVIPLTLRARDADRVGRLKMMGWATAGLVIVLLPWAAYNSTRFNQPVLLSDQLGLLAVSANCDSTYYGEIIGYWNIRCAQGVVAPTMDEDFDRSDRDVFLRDAALDYMIENRDQLPSVIASRIGRLWVVRDPRTQIQLEWYAEGRSKNITEGAVFGMYVLAYLSIWGAIELRRRKIIMYPLVGVIVAVTVTAAMTYGLNRFRATAEVALILLAAVAIEAAVAITQREIARRRATAPRAPDEVPTEPDRTPVAAS